MTGAAIPAEQHAGSEKPARKVRLRPRDAASLILIDRSGPGMRVLVGRRSSGHAFMPDTYVFPGGRCDAGDHALPFCSDLHPLVLEKLSERERTRKTARAMRALGLAAIRELEEETGLIIGTDKGAAADGRRLVEADLSCLRYVARAITPPTYNKRFDARFFLAFTDEAGIEPGDARETHELQDMRWIDLDNYSDVNMPDITRLILGDIQTLVSMDPAMPYGSAVSFYFNQRGQHVRLTI